MASQNDPMLQSLGTAYVEKCMKKWSGVLKAGKEIKNEHTAMVTALMLENTQREMDGPSGRRPMINESGFGITDVNAPANGASLFGANDARIPSIVIPTARRIFPELLAHDLFGVQAMPGPAGFAFAWRALYGDGREIGYNTVDTKYTGAKTAGTSSMMENELSANYGYPTEVFGAASSVASKASAAWLAFAGSNGDNFDGQGANTTDAEYWAVNSTMPKASFRLEKGIVEAKTRKIGTNFSLEVAEDMMNMQGLDVDSEMVNLMSYEIQAEIDRQLVGEAIKAAINYNKISTWSPVSADGRNQLERIGTLYTQVLMKSQDIAIQTRRGPASWAISSPNVVGLFERLSDFACDEASVEADSQAFGVAKVGSLRKGAIKLYRDTFATGDYVLLGLKGKTAYDSGIIYCPYIPLQIMRAQGQDDFTPRVGIRTRYGVLDNLFGTGRYYHMIVISGMQSTGLVGDSASNRLFTY